MAICQCWSEGHFLLKVLKEGDIDTIYFLSSNIKIPHLLVKWPVPRVCLGPGGPGTRVSMTSPSFPPPPWAGDHTVITIITCASHQRMEPQPRVGPAPLPLPSPLRLPQISPRHHYNPDLIQVTNISVVAFFKTGFYHGSWVLSV